MKILIELIKLIKTKLDGIKFDYLFYQHKKWTFKYEIALNKRTLYLTKINKFMDDLEIEMRDNPLKEIKLDEVD